ncbi:MAG: PIN domain-containing protein [Rhizobiaceae bacterium]|nr:PIN domain-containing protein [Rhizobiaceae bacterium]
MGGADVFLDTNILLYAATARLDSPGKWEIAYGLLTTPFGTSGQVLGEFYANAVRKGSKPLDDFEARRWVELLSQKPFVPVDANLVRKAIELKTRYQISYWDAAIVAAAEKLGAGTLYSEDLNHGQIYGAVKVINPFLQS